MLTAGSDSSLAVPPAYDPYRRCTDMRISLFPIVRFRMLPLTAGLSAFAATKLDKQGNDDGCFLV